MKNGVTMRRAEASGSMGHREAPGDWSGTMRMERLSFQHLGEQLASNGEECLK